MNKNNDHGKNTEHNDKIRINRNLTRSHVALTDDVTEIEFCEHDSEYGVLLISGDPLWGANMKTPIIEKLFRYFDENQISTMRFSFTRYQIFNNNYDKYITQAAVCLEEFFKVMEVSKKVWVIGYSFGSLVALNLALRRPDIHGVIMLSPPILNYDFISWYMPFNAKVLVAYGTRDHLIPENIIEAYVKYLAMNKMSVSICPILGADHHLKGKEEQIARECLSFMYNSDTIDDV
jgi:alpha/beta superfamily hydrolase